MHNILLSGAAVLAAVSGVQAKSSQALCANAVEDGGNWYCSSVQKIKYTGLPTSGIYQDVTSFAGNKCNKSPFNWNGVGGPVREPLSLHLRGPIIMNQTAVYYPAPKAKRSINHHFHGHQRFHERRQAAREAEEQAKAEEKRQVGAVVTATIDGKVVTWLNNWDGKGVVNPTPAPAAPPAIAPAAVAPAAAPGAPAVPAIDLKLPTLPKLTKPKTDVKIEDGDWTRTGYFSIAGEKTGLSFLGPWGSWPKPGDEDQFLGFRLGETKFDGKLKSHDEVMIFSDEDCDATCGLVRPGAVNKKGFGGARKMFVFQFSMADDGHRNFEGIGNWPAIWSLNAKIPRIQQYGDCSCWGTGCGEVDFFETLGPGEQRCKSTFHQGLGKGGGDSNYLPRPTDPQNPVTGVALFYDDTITVAYVDDFPWGEKVDAATIERIMGTDSNSNTNSLFALSN